MKKYLYSIALAGVLVIGLLAGTLAYCRWTGQVPRPLLDILLRRIKLPAGFRITLYASPVPNARAMALGPDGIVFVGSRRAGRVYAVLPNSGMNRAKNVITIARGLNTPTGVAFHDGALYVAAVDRILRYDNIEARLNDPPAPVVVTTALPREVEHGSRFIRFGPDGWLYVSVGIPCNVCEPKDDLHGTILRMQPDGTDQQVFASGIRNSVGFDWQPQTKDLWFTDNGRDGMGDNIPPDELNHAPHAGMNFGFPYCHGRDIPDPIFGRKHTCSEFEPPAVDLPAHVAALGMRFYTGDMFPAVFDSRIFIAEHGSWNRSVPTGDRISVVDVSGNQADRYQPFAEGWQIGRIRWGRPVDVLVMQDGALLVSDDYAGAIYQISYAKR
jgi:glucose/arabinose dehydrogenase